MNISNWTSEHIKRDYGKIDCLINNVGVANFGDLSIELESVNFNDMSVNFNGTVLMTTAMLPLLKKSKEAKIIIVSSILALVPVYRLPIYSASKAALHSYAVSLRAQLKNINVLEVLPPLVDTPLAAAVESDDKMSPSKVATLIIKASSKNTQEIYPGIAKVAKFVNRFSPKMIRKVLNK